MASRVLDPGAALHQEPIADYVMVRTDEVDRGDRLREIDQVWGKALGALMAKDGQQTPIQVCRLPGRNRWTLVVGAHRHFGAEFIGIEHMKAEIVSAERDSRRLREIVENLHRRDLDPLDRASFLAELVALKRARAGVAVVAGRDAMVAAHLRRAVDQEATETLETISRVYGWTEEIGAQLGFTGRTVRNDLMLYRQLPPSSIERLRAARHPILGNASQLRALAKLAPADRDRVVDTLLGVALNGRTITSVAQALTVGGGGAAPADPEAKRLSAFLGAFQRMGQAERKAAIAHLLPLIPAGSLPTGKAEPQWPAEHVRYREEALAAIDTVRELIDALEEDQVVPGERGADLYRAGADLQIVRMTIAGNGFELASPAEVEQPDDLLTAGIDAIADGLAEEMDPDWIANDLVRRFRATTRFANGTYELRLGGAVGTCTSGGLPMLQSWVRAAQKKRDRRAAR